MSVSNLRESALTILRAALAAADPRAAVRRAVQREGDRLRVGPREYDLARTRRIIVIGFGKASAAMAQPVEELLGDRISAGAVTVKYGHTTPLRAVQVCEAGHPLPDENSLEGTRRIIDQLARAGPGDLIICLISGGGSALLESPPPEISLDDLRATTVALLRSGATIEELNALRKHLSLVKGGQLARRVSAGATLLSLILSDVIGSPVETIASGPTAPDSTTWADAQAVIERRGLSHQLPSSVVERIARGVRGEAEETPKADDPIFTRVHNLVIADNALALDAARGEAERLGFHTLLLSTFVQGEARETAKFLAAIAREIARSNQPAPRPSCVLAGGETTVTVRGAGKGGRNQELALAAGIEIAGLDGVLILSAGSDGTDGPTDAAGAWADGSTAARAAVRGLDPHAFLADNDAYHFFQALGDLIITGPTQTNVNDVMMVLAA